MDEHGEDEIPAAWRNEPRDGDLAGDQASESESGPAFEPDGKALPGETVPSAPLPAYGAGPMPLSMPPFTPIGPRGTAGHEQPEAEPLGVPGAGGDARDAAASPPPARRRMPVAAAVALAALAAGGIGAGLGAAFSGGSTVTSAPSHVPVVPSPSASSQARTGATESTAAIAKAVEPAIVDIDTDVASMASQGQEQAAGTGMIITSSGEVLTNNHVVELATHISISIQGHPGTYGASVIGVDPSKDVALLQIEGYSGALPTVSLGDSASVAVGAPVVAIGNALGLGAQPTTVTGVVSALDRTITATDATSSSTETLHGLLETDAPIQPGDSGGPLVDAHGQVIGMDTAALSSAGSGATLGFAIPIDEARTVVQHMERGQAVDGVVLGERPFLGVFEAGSGVSSSGGLSLGAGAPASVRGVVVEDVAIGGPAQAAGIEAGDTITRIDATPTPTPTALEKALDAHGIGAQVAVTYVDAAGTVQTVDVTLAGIPS